MLTPTPTIPRRSRRWHGKGRAESDEPTTRNEAGDSGGRGFDDVPVVREDGAGDPDDVLSVRQGRSPRAGAGRRAGAWVNTGEKLRFVGFPGRSLHRARTPTLAFRATPLPLGSKSEWILVALGPSPAPTGRAPPTKHGEALRSQVVLRTPSGYRRNAGSWKPVHAMAPRKNPNRHALAAPRTRSTTMAVTP